MPKIGAKAPTFSLMASGDTKVALKDFLGKKVVLYFYPRDNTPGCTQEACDFRDNMGQLTKLGAVVLGVSKDSVASHDKFASKYELPFLLLSDPDNAVATKYDAYGEKNMYGKKVMGTIRSTFIIDESGKLTHSWSKVKVKGHVDAVMAALGGAESGQLVAPKPTSKKKVAKKPAAKKPTSKKSTTKKSATSKRARA